MSSGRGGQREGAGRKSVWRNGETQTIRVPKILVVQLLEIAKKLDEGETIEFVSQSKRKFESVTQSNYRAIDDATRSGESCPHCGVADWRIEGYRTLKSGEKKQKRQCRNCDRIWSVLIEQA